MKQKKYIVIGVMSGTSLDGIDLAVLEITIAPRFSYTFGTTTTIPYSAFWKEQLQQAIQFSSKELEKLNEEYTHYLAQQINDFIRREAIIKIDAICSHGHTVLHQPEAGITLQIGNLPILTELIQQKVVCDFRVQDVQLGGQGAPLVPIGDELFFKEYDYCLNLGGFANCSFENNQKQRIAYDICPVNIVLNSYAQLLGKAYDAEGAFAKAGTVNMELLKQLNALSFYDQFPPKSLGLEWVQECVLPILEAAQLPPKAILATFTEHVAMQLAKQFVDNTRILVTGGGAYNTFLLDRVRHYTKAQLHVPDQQLIEFKEALIFGLLGVLRLEDQINCLSSVTGAQRDHCSGMIYN